MIAVLTALLMSLPSAPATERAEYLRPCETGLTGAAHLLSMPRTTAELRQVLLDFGALNSSEFQVALLRALANSGYGDDGVPSLKAWVKSLAGVRRAAPALATLTFDDLAAVASTPLRRAQLAELAGAVATTGRRDQVLSIMAVGVRESLARTSWDFAARTLDRRIKLGINLTYTAAAIGLIPFGLKQFDAFYGQAHFFWTVDHNDLFAHMNAAVRTQLGLTTPLIPAVMMGSVLRQIHAGVRSTYLPPEDGTPSLIEKLPPPAETTLGAADRIETLTPVELTYLGRAEMLTIIDTVTALRERWRSITAAWAVARAAIDPGGDHASAIGQLRDDVLNTALSLRARRAQLKAYVEQVGVARARLAGFARPGTDDDATLATRRALAHDVIERGLASIPAPAHVIDDDAPAIRFEAAIARLAGVLTDLQLATGARVGPLVERADAEFTGVDAEFFDSAAN